jgi:hypothetical protein
LLSCEHFCIGHFFETSPTNSTQTTQNLRV